MIGEIARGEVVGEVGMIERAPRGATVTALRDSTLARFSTDTFRALTSAHPTLMLQLSRHHPVPGWTALRAHGPCTVDRRRRHRPARHAESS